MEYILRFSVTAALDMILKFARRRFAGWGPRRVVGVRLPPRARAALIEISRTDGITLSHAAEEMVLVGLMARRMAAVDAGAADPEVKALLAELAALLSIEPSPAK
ncbi:MAG: hypothetical protein OEV94_11970 [Deltaproteobacteria bacterium]|nr:hypothetical protein [Deltaproteobacteria bacterium]